MSEFTLVPAGPDTGRYAAAPGDATTRGWAIAATVTDPEVPVLTIADLGVLRKVEQHDGTFVVTITPTYSGCPAMEDIAARIVAAFDAAGLRAEVDTVFRPAWSTDWITPEGRAKLVAYGIAAPHPVTTAPAGDSGTLFVRPAVVCPRCASRQTTLVSEFGSTACKALYRCRRCDEPFDYFKEL